MKKITLAVLMGFAMLQSACAQTKSQSTPEATGSRAYIEQQGFTFVKEIPAPEGMTGWVGHTGQTPASVFISKDDKFYIIGDLYDTQGNNLSEKQLETHVKPAVLDEVWKTLERSTWIQDGKTDASKIVYVFSDPNCPYCQKLWEMARPWVESGKVQLRHIQVAVIREESRGQIATLLSSANPEENFTKMNLNKGEQKLKVMQNIPKEIDDKINANQELMEQYGFYATPSMVWRDAKGDFQSSQGLNRDLKEIFEK